MNYTQQFHTFAAELIITVSAAAVMTTPCLNQTRLALKENDCVFFSSKRIENCFRYDQLVYLKIPTTIINN